MFAGREVFSPTHMSSVKTDCILFRRFAAKLYEVFGNIRKDRRRCGGLFLWAGNQPKFVVKYCSQAIAGLSEQKF